MNPMAQTLAKEVRWFLAALLLSATLSPLFWLLHRTIDTPDGTPPALTARIFGIGWAVMFACLYAGRITLRFLRDRLTD